MKFKTFLILIFGLAFSALTFVSNAQTSLLPDVQAERAKYCPTINKAEASEILNTVAWNNRSDGWGLSGKTAGNSCPFATGTIACDILHHQPSNIIVDVLGSAPDDESPLGPANPIWLVHGRQTQSNRPWVAPVQPSNVTTRDCSPQPPQVPPSAPQPPGQPPGNSNGQSQSGTDFTQIFDPNPNPVSEGATTPSLPELPPVRDFGELIQSIFGWALALVGAAVFVNFLWAGFLWFTAAGRTGPIGQAKEKMTNALIGAIIFLASYLILKTINPDLVQQTFTLPGLQN